MKIALTAGLILCSTWTSAFAQVPKGRIMFSSMVDNSKKSELYIVNSDGTNEHQLSHSGKRIDFSDFSQDRIAYMQVETDGRYKGYSSILVAGTDFTDIKVLIDHKGICNPKWQPGGKLIAYEYYHDTLQEIWVMDGSGENKHKLVGNARHPYWSADGRQLLFTRNYEVFSFDMKKSTETQLTHLAGTQYIAKWPAISPNGKKIAFKIYDEKKGGEEAGIMVLDQGNGSTKIISRCDIPYWTSDNKYIVCSCTPEKRVNDQIAIVNIETGEKTFITHNQRSNYFPVWMKEK